VLAAADAPALVAAIGRNIWRDDSHPFAAALADYALRAVEGQRTEAAEAMFEAQGWPALAET